MNETKLSAAKLWLISDPPDPHDPLGPRGLPYLSTALFALTTVTSTGIARMSVDEWWRLYVNPDWLDMATVPEVAAELAHMIWHLLHDHTGRARGLDVDSSNAEHWHLAADVPIERTLSGERLAGELPSARGNGLPDDLAAEEYYAIVSRLEVPHGGADSNPPAQEPTVGCGSGADGIPRSHEIGPEADIGQVGWAEANEIRRLVAIEHREHRPARPGTQPGDALRWTFAVLEPNVAWEPILAATVRRSVGWAAGRGEFTYRRLSRRAASVPNVVLPGQYRQVPSVAVVVDTSASVDDVLLARARGEVDNVLGSLGVLDAGVAAIAVDAAVHNTQRVRRSRDLQLAGGGGTDLRHGIVAAGELRPRPDVIIVFTDGFTPWPAAPPPGASVVIALLAHSRRHLPPTPPWAVRVECITEGRC